MTGPPRRIEIAKEGSPPGVRRHRKQRQIGGLFTVAGIVVTIGGAAYYVHRDWQPDADATVAAMQVEYRCVKCSKSFSLSVAKAGEMRRQHGDIICPACGATGSEKQDVEVVVSGEDGVSFPNSPSGKRADQNDASKPVQTRTMEQP